MRDLPVGGARPTKRRRTKAEMAQLRSALADIVSEGAPMTVRQVSYQAVTRAIVDKTEQQYKAVGRLLVLMRRDGSIDFDDIADNTRWMRKPRTYGSIEDALSETARLYRRQVWADLDCRVEVWLEKEALAGVLMDVTPDWDVPLMVTRGYPSLSYIHGAGESIQAHGIETFIYYFGDHDPSGVDIARHVELVQVELDALPPETLRSLYEAALTEHWDTGVHQEVLTQERIDRAQIQGVLDSLAGGDA